MYTATCGTIIADVIALHLKLLTFGVHRLEKNQSIVL